jgi:hypothetical protein
MMELGTAVRYTTFHWVINAVFIKNCGTFSIICYLDQYNNRVYRLAANEFLESADLPAIILPGIDLLELDIMFSTSVKTYGAFCMKCKENYPYAETNTPDSFVCWGCK